MLLKGKIYQSLKVYGLLGWMKFSKKKRANSTFPFLYVGMIVIQKRAKLTGEPT